MGKVVKRTFTISEILISRKNIRPNSSPISDSAVSKGGVNMGVMGAIAPTVLRNAL